MEQNSLYYWEALFDILHSIVLYVCFLSDLTFYGFFLLLLGHCPKHSIAFVRVRLFVRFFIAEKQYFSFSLIKNDHIEMFDQDMPNRKKNSFFEIKFFSCMTNITLLNHQER